MDDVKIYKEIGDVNQDVLKYDSITVYKSSDIQKPYLVSFLFSYNLHINLRQTSELLWSVFQQYRLDDPVTVSSTERSKSIMTYTSTKLSDIQLPYLDVVDKKLPVEISPRRLDSASRPSTRLSATEDTC